MLARSLSIVSVCLLAVFIAVGCHTVPLGDADTSTVDSAFNGWYKTEGDNPKSFVYIKPYDSHTYIATLYSYTGDLASPKADLKFTNKAWLTRVGGMDVMTFKIIDPEWDLEGADASAARYSYYRIRKTDGGGIEATPLNTDFLKDTKTPEELAKKIADNVNNEELWRNSEPMNLKPVPENKMDDVKRVVQAFAPVK